MIPQNPPRNNVRPSPQQAAGKGGTKPRNGQSMRNGQPAQALPHPRKETAQPGGPAGRWCSPPPFPRGNRPPPKALPPASRINRNGSFVCVGATGEYRYGAGAACNGLPWKGKNRQEKNRQKRQGENRRCRGWMAPALGLLVRVAAGSCHSVWKIVWGARLGITPPAWPLPFSESSRF